MGKKKIDRLSLIENKMQRNVAFCKRKRGFLKKAIELSQLCAQNILVIIHDKEKNRVVQYSSEDTFTFKQAYDALKRSTEKKLQSVGNSSYEKFTN
jgi:YD repeat-containing protein